MNYKITKLVFNEKDGITALEIRDESGNIINPLSAQNKAVSEINSGNLLELPNITEKSLVFSGDSKTEKTVPQRKTVRQIFEEWYNRHQKIFLDHRNNFELNELERFWEIYYPKTENWKGKMFIDELWTRWLEGARR